jgi:hypothetical protein
VYLKLYTSGGDQIEVATNRRVKQQLSVSGYYHQSLQPRSYSSVTYSACKFCAVGRWFQLFFEDFAQEIASITRVKLLLSERRSLALQPWRLDLGRWSGHACG